MFYKYKKCLLLLAVIVFLTVILLSINCFSIMSFPKEPIKWQWHADSAFTLCKAPAIGTDGNIYFTGGGMTDTGVSAKLFCVNPEGSMLWQSQELDTYKANSPVIGTDGTIYVVGWYKFYAFNQNGTLKWEWTTPESGNPYPHFGISGTTIGPDKTIYIYHSESGAYHRYIFALNSNGSIKWTKDLADPDIGNGAKALTVGKDGVLYTLQMPGGVGTLYAYNPDNGAIIWSLELNDNVKAGGFAIGSDGTIYIPTYYRLGKLIAVSPSGEIKWEYNIPDPGIPSIGPDGTIYVVGSSSYVDGDLYALTSKGTLKWNEGNAVESSNLAISSDGNIYGKLDFKHGLNFSIVTPYGFAICKLNIFAHAGSPAIGSDGTVYVCGSGVLTAIEGSAPLASSSWPRARGGNRSTGAYEKQKQ
jgi:outer membrane protein assembly factor BamB